MVSKSYIYRMFGQSPIKPLQQHMEKVVACVNEVLPLFEAVINGDRKLVNSQQKKISRLEREADVLKKELRLHLPNSLLLPVPRADLLELLTMQDRIANTAKDVAGLIAGRNMEFPSVIAEPLRDFLIRCTDAVKQAEQTVNELDELVATGFRGREVDIVNAMLKKLDEIEADTDRIQVQIRATLFGIEKSLPPIDAMFLYKMIESTGDIADYAQRVGSHLQVLLAR